MTNLATVFKAESDRYEELKAVVLKANQAVYEWVSALDEIRSKKLFRVECPTWEEWCIKFLGKTANAIKQGRYYGKHRPEILDRLKKKRQLMAPKPAQEPPAAEPAPAQPAAADVKPPAAPAIPEDARAKIHTLAVLAKRLMSSDEDLGENEEFRFLTRQLLKLDEQLTQAALPGFAELPSAKARGTLKQVQEYCLERKLTAQDAEWFFNKCEGVGWKISNNAIKDWKAVVRQWQAAGIFPSLKGTNGGQINARSSYQGAAGARPDYSKGF